MDGRPRPARAPRIGFLVLFVLLPPDRRGWQEVHVRTEDAVEPSATTATTGESHSLGRRPGGHSDHQTTSEEEGSPSSTTVDATSLWFGVEWSTGRHCGRRRRSSSTAQTRDFPPAGQIVAGRSPPTGGLPRSVADGAHDHGEPRRQPIAQLRPHRSFEQIREILGLRSFRELDPGLRGRPVAPDRVERELVRHGKCLVDLRQKIVRRRAGHAAEATGHPTTIPRPVSLRLLQRLRSEGGERPGGSASRLGPRALAVLVPPDRVRTGAAGEVLPVLRVPEPPPRAPPLHSVRQ